MTSEEFPPASPASGHPAEQSIAALLKLAGERTQPTSAAILQARAAAHASWQLAVKRNQFAVRKRRVISLFLGGALAASVVATVLVLATRTGSPSVEVAQIVKIEGDVTQLDRQRSFSAAAPSPVMSGEVIQTSQGRVALSMNGLSLRLDRNTRLLAMSATDVQLDYGRVYVDSQAINSRMPLRIHTAEGVVQHQGTQFQVYAGNGTTRTLVREGRVKVELANSTQRVEIVAGQAVTMADDRMDAVQATAAYGDEWSWAADIAPDFVIEDRPLADFLSWIAREHGWHLQYASGEVEKTALETRLHGALPTNNLQQQLENIGLITGTHLQVDKGLLLVSRQTD